MFGICGILCRSAEAIWLECSLFHFGEIVFSIVIKRQLANFDEWIVVMQPGFCRVLNVTTLAQIKIPRLASRTWGTRILLIS